MKGVVCRDAWRMVPAAIVARELDIRMIETVLRGGYHYDDSNPQQAEETKINSNAATSAWRRLAGDRRSGRYRNVGCGAAQINAQGAFAAVYAKPAASL